MESAETVFYAVEKQVARPIKSALHFGK